MSDTLVIALDRMGRLQTTYWRTAGSSAQRYSGVRPPEALAAETASSIRGTPFRRPALHQANDQNQRRRTLAPSPQFLSQEEEKS